MNSPLRRGPWIEDRRYLSKDRRAWIVWSASRDPKPGCSGRRSACHWRWKLERGIATHAPAGTARPSCSLRLCRERDAVDEASSGASGCLAQVGRLA
jgi:hypothetical protein